MESYSQSNSHLHEVVFSDRHFINKLDKLRELIRYLDRKDHLRSQNIFMLIRPHGFGLSLTNEALESIFSRDELLMDHLASKEDEEGYDLDLENVGTYTVLHFIFSKTKVSNSIDHAHAMGEVIQQVMWQHHVKLKQRNSLDLRGQLYALIKELYIRDKQPVVILIDNYEVPILHALGINDPNERLTALTAYFDMLNAIRQAKQMVQFCLITGHVKFPLSNIESEGLPSIIDLSYGDMTDTLFGFTREEIAETYAEDLSQIAPQQGVTISEYLDSLEQCYGGYVFSDEQKKVLRPASVLNAIDNDGALFAYACDYDYSFVKHCIEENDCDFAWLLNKDGQDQLLLEEISLDLKDKELGSMLAQLGFVSINKVTFSENEHSMSWRYRYDLTNVEMRRAFQIVTGISKPELRDLPINPRVFDDGEEEYLVENEEKTTKSRNEK